MSKMIVYDPHGRTTTYEGHITIDDRHYRLGPDTALSRIFFRARDTTGGLVKDPVTKNPVWDTKHHTDRFFVSPAAYFQYRNPPPKDAEDREQYQRDVAAWTARREAFVSKHAEWFATRSNLLHHPPVSEDLQRQNAGIDVDG